MDDHHGGPPRPRAPRRPISRTRRVSLAQLAPEVRATLCADAYAIYARYKTGVDRDTFDRQFLADDSARAALFYSHDGELVGFACASLHRIVHAGRIHAVYGAMLFIDTDYRGTREATYFAVTEALRVKLREPRTPLAYLGVVTSPASYRMFAAAMPTYYPSRRTPVPPAVHQLVRSALDRRGLALEDDQHLLVRGLGAPAQPARLLAAASLRDDPDARFYLDRNPRFSEGVAMLLWVPLTLQNLLGALARLVGLGQRDA